jgi:hypothetical protein
VGVAWLHKAETNSNKVAITITFCHARHNRIIDKFSASDTSSAM